MKLMEQRLHLLAVLLSLGVELKEGCSLSNLHVLDQQNGRSEVVALAEMQAVGQLPLRIPLQLRGQRHV